jgi:hypothetical protein
MNAAQSYAGIGRTFLLCALVSCGCPRLGRCQCVPTEGKVPAADKKAAAKLDLRYAWQPNQDYQYEVSVDAELPDRKLTYKGFSTYRVHSAENGQFVLVHKGSLQQHEVMKPQARAAMPRGSSRGLAHRPPHHLPGSHYAMPRFADHEVTIDQHGKILKLSGTTAMPLLLGDLALLVIEPLPEKRERQWQVNYGLTVVEKKKTPANQFPRRLSRPGAEEAPATQRPGGESMTYRVKGTAGGMVTILKQSHLKTADESDGAASREQEGVGELVFDQKRGVMAKAEIKFVNIFNQDNIAVKVPVVMQYRLLDEEELARSAEEGKERLAKLAEERAQADEKSAQPFSDDEAREIVAALKNAKSRRDAVQMLTKKKQPDEHQEQIARALNPLLADRDDGIKQAAAEALKIWGTELNVPGLVKLVVEQDNVFIRARAMEALGQLKDKRGAEAVALLFVTSRGDARKSLEQMGSVAEPYVLPFLDNPDEGVRSDACRVLAAIGTSKSRAKLEQIALKPRGSDAQAAREALAKIESP